MKVFLLIEPSYNNTFWCLQTISGICEEANKKRYETCYLDALKIEEDPHFKDLCYCRHKLLIIIGTSPSWLPKILDIITSYGIHAILVGLEPLETSINVSSVLMDHTTATRKLISYLFSLGRHKIALYGINPNSYADILKKQCFTDLLTKMGIDNHASCHYFLNNGSLAQCYKSFRNKLNLYDAIICANDIVAISLINRLKSDSIRVPQDKFIVSFGNTLIGSLFTPSLTTVALDHHELGRQSILLYSYLYKQSSLMSASVKLDCKIIVRETTLETQILQGFPYYLSPNIPSIDFYEDSEVNKIMQIEDFITRCDDLDFLILRGLFNEIPYSKLSETIYITENAIRYRVKRMLSWLSLETEECLLSTIEEYISPSAIDNAISIKSKQNHR